MQKSKQKQAKSENEFIIFFLCQNIHRFQYKDTTPCRITCLLSNTKQIIAIYELHLFYQNYPASHIIDICSKNQDINR